MSAPARRVRALAALALAGLLAACEIPRPLNPVLIYNRISGRDEALRPPPPGLDGPRPNLGSIPPRPERPPPGATDAISAALTEDRLRSREALADRATPAPAAGFAPGKPPVPGGPPPPPPLAAAPAIPWDRPIGPAAAPGPGPGAPALPQAAPPAAPMPSAPPPPPPPDLLGLPR